MARKITIKIPNKSKYYPVRTENSLSRINKWVKYARKEYPQQKLIIVNNFKIKMATKDKETKKYWKLRFKGGYEPKYVVYGSYKGA